MCLGIPSLGLFGEMIQPKQKQSDGSSAEGTMNEKENCNTIFEESEGGGSNTQYKWEKVNTMELQKLKRDMY